MSFFSFCNFILHFGFFFIVSFHSFSLFYLHFLLITFFPVFFVLFWFGFFYFFLNWYLPVYCILPQTITWWAYFCWTWTLTHWLFDWLICIITLILFFSSQRVDGSMVQENYWLSKRNLLHNLHLHIHHVHIPVAPSNHKPHSHTSWEVAHLAVQQKWWETKMTGEKWCETFDFGKTDGELSWKWW